VLFFDDSISFFVSHLRSVRKYLDVFVIFVKRSIRFHLLVSGPNALSLMSNCLSLIGFQDGLSYLGTISILLMSICVSPRYSDVLINRGCGIVGRIAYSSSFQMVCVCVYSNHRFCAVQLPHFVQLCEACSPSLKPLW
jgi:hypothetical protein